MRNRLLVVCTLLVACATVAYATDFAVIVHPTNPVKVMALSDLGKIFKGKTAAWANGRSVTIVLREPSSPGMKFVIEKVMGVSADEGKTILNDESHKSAASIIFVPSDEDIVRAVGSNPTAIGVVDVYNITSAVKVIKIDDKQPFDIGYVLKGH